MSSAVVYNTSFIYFDNEGLVHGVSNVPSNEYKNFEINNDLILDFFLQKKNVGNYNINYFYNLSKGTIEVEEEQQVVNSNLSLYLIPRTSAYNNEITIEHSSNQKKWIVNFRNDVSDKLDIVPKLIFFVTKIDNPYFLYRTFTVTPNSNAEKVEIEFKIQNEFNLNEVSLLTVKKFNSYGIKEVA